LYASTYYALHDTRTPLRYAILRVALGMILGYTVAIHLPGWIGIDRKWGAAGLTASSGLAGWVEFVLLRRTLNQRIGRTGLASSYLMKLWFGAAVGAVIGWGIKLIIPPLHPLITAGLVLVPFGLAYFAVTAGLKVTEASAVFKRVLRMVGVKKK
jgi:putative peptidoglycan lipid II flippase